MSRDRHHDAKNDETNVWPGSLVAATVVIRPEFLAIPGDERQD
jgi:hypothetical protein